MRVCIYTSNRVLITTGESSHTSISCFCWGQVRSDSDSEPSQRGAWVSSQFQQKGAQLYASLASGMKGSSQRLKTTFAKLLTDRKKLERCRAVCMHVVFQR